VEAAITRFGQIDILSQQRGNFLGAPAEEMRLEQWNKVLETNLTGTFLCSQAVGKVMMGQKRGKIINVASIAGHGWLAAGTPGDRIQRQQGRRDQLFSARPGTTSGPIKAIFM